MNVSIIDPPRGGGGKIGEGSEPSLCDRSPIGRGDTVAAPPLLDRPSRSGDDFRQGSRTASVGNNRSVSSHDDRRYVSYPIRVNLFGSFSTHETGRFHAMSERHDRLRQARIANGFKTKAEAVRRFGWNSNSYKSNENGNAPFSFDQAVAYGKAFKVRSEWLYSNHGPMRADGEVPIIGRVGADPAGRVIRTAGQAPTDMVPMPTGSTSEAVAVEVDGHSMRGFADDGALVFFENQHTPPSEEMLGEIVVVQVAEGDDPSDDEDILIKRLQRGSRDGLYDLESINGPPMRDVRIRWAAEIIQITPPRQARRLIRRGLA